MINLDSYSKEKKELKVTEELQIAKIKNIYQPLLNPGYYCLVMGKLLHYTINRRSDYYSVVGPTPFIIAEELENSKFKYNILIKGYKEYQYNYLSVEIYKVKLDQCGYVPWYHIYSLDAFCYFVEVIMKYESYLKMLEL